ncbi:hypothetical protein A2U01_0054402, partial [Trifolium medium]|nr:hypothetical protein [Trifolium medium]
NRHLNIIVKEHETTTLRSLKEHVTTTVISLKRRISSVPSLVAGRSVHRGVGLFQRGDRLAEAATLADVDVNSCIVVMH